MHEEGNALELFLLGGFRARLASGNAVVLPTRKSRALLAYLALRPDRPHPREVLAALLWSDRPEPKAHNSLSQAVTALRKGLGAVAPAPLVIDTDSLTFRNAAAAVDAVAFEQFATGSGTEDLERAQELYEGDLLAGIGVRDPAFEEWLELERERLRALALETLTKLLARRVSAGEHVRAGSTAKRLLALDPLDESAHRALMRAYALQGRVGLALREYRNCAEILRRDLGVEPDAETTRLYEEILQRRSEAPANVGGSPGGAGAELESLPVNDQGAPRDSVSDGTQVAVENGIRATPIARRATRLRSRWRTAAAAAVVALSVLVVALWGVHYGKPPSERAAPMEPSIAVLPFVNMSDDPGQDYFADGMTEDLITDLGKISGLFVISRNSAFAFRDRGRSPERIADELGVRYVLEGSVRRASDRVRINVQLIDAASGGHVWAERFDGAAADVFELQDRITARIVGALALELLPAERRRLEHRETVDVAAHDAYLLGLSAYYRRTPEDNARAAKHFERAIAIDRHFSAAYSALAKVYARTMVTEQAYADALGIYWSDGYTRARQLLEYGMAEPNADVHVLRSWLALRKHQHARAIAEAEQALALNPNDADALEALAEALIFSGWPEKGMEFARQAMRRNPVLLARPMYLLGLAEFARGDPQAAVPHVERALENAPAREADFSALLAAALGELERKAEAAEAFRAFSESFLNRPDRAWSVRTLSFANPRFHTWRRIDLAWSVYSFPFAQKPVLERLAAGLAAAGAPASVGGYLALSRSNRLSGEEIRSLLFGREIQGTDFWLSEHGWQEKRGADGRVEHVGYPIHPGLPASTTGRGWIDGDRLCERWPALSESFEVCVTIFRVPEQAARTRWGDYVMVTDTGPHPFSTP